MASFRPRFLIIAAVATPILIKFGKPILRKAATELGKLSDKLHSDPSPLSPTERIGGRSGRARPPQSRPRKAESGKRKRAKTARAKRKSEGD